jgi:hypothetical protein
MRRELSLFVALAIVGCASEDFSGTEQGTSPSAGADVNGTWNVTWGPLTGTNTYNDTTVVMGTVSVQTGEVRDSCTVTGTLTLTRAPQGVAYVTGPWTITAGSCTQTDSLDVATTTAYTDGPGSIANANLGSGTLTFSLEALNRRFQYGLVEGNSMSGSTQWSITMPARPTKSRGTVRGEFTATKQ